MKSKLTVFAIAFFLFAQTASAQQSRADNNHGRYTQQNNSNSDRNAPEYRTRGNRYNNRNKNIMTDRAFRQALVSIQRESFDNDKIRLARLLVSRNNMTTAQIRTIAQLFGFDSSKLEFTKYAYASCIDPQHYYQIGRIFSFSSSRRELYDYLARV